MHLHRVISRLVKNPFKKVIIAIVGSHKLRIPTDLRQRGSERLPKRRWVVNVVMLCRMPFKTHKNASNTIVQLTQNAWKDDDIWRWWCTHRQCQPNHPCTLQTGCYTIQLKSFKPILLTLWITQTQQTSRIYDEHGACCKRREMTSSLAYSIRTTRLKRVDGCESNFSTKRRSQSVGLDVKNREMDAHNAPFFTTPLPPDPLLRCNFSVLVICTGSDLDFCNNPSLFARIASPSS